MVFAGHSGLVRNLCFDGNRIVSASYDQTIRVWDIKYVSTNDPMIFN